ncbi:cytidine deaminase [Marchantia polymorpha subsp. ruderalis]|uniref:cytidine deaminase n=2 Tax=Marchantia polymorpha TaxID=3197 RepID=A0AAF6BRQ0_MARPO|nr:hypothetical protein MARPO_0047s0014 [Marchantia polymorpha]BBN14684.1 hypothetical protein Mp_6g13630 [Marchantia polymorpha subsp. ruderalis]|eukprot:PTQ39022.1 hypothetical protein MARPO_0047s0014 [Marchantia polymorpha]
MKEGKLPFVIEAEEVDRLHKASGLSLEGFLATLVEPTRSLARAPISKFHVGAVGLGSSGRVFRGVNIEFVGLPLNNSIHAEQFLVANAARNGERRLQFLAVSAAPCGHCRQFLQELRGASDLRILIADSKAETHELSYFLPHRFGPQDLLEDDFPLLLEPQSNSLCLNPSPQEASDILEDATRHSAGHHEDHSVGSVDQSVQGMNGMTLAIANGQGHEERANFSDQQLLDAAPEAQKLIQLQSLALEAANHSYAPYTNCPSGLSMMTRKGNLYKGSYFESAAYNPSLPPLQAAVVAFVAEGGGQFDEILHVALVEKAGATVRQADTIKLVLDRISPKASFRVFEA